MMLDVKSFVGEWKEEIKGKIQEMDSRPTLTIIQIGNNPASTKYVDNKIKDCKEVGIIVTLYRIEEGSCPTTAQLAQIINHDDSDGLMVQLPVPKKVDVNKATRAALIEERDVDGFLRNSAHQPATAKGIITYLDSLGLEGKGKTALVIGRSEIVGKPTAKLLLNRDWTVIQAHSKTDPFQLHEFIKSADLVVCAVGKKEFLDAQWAKKGAIIVDVGTNWDGKKLVGDVFNHDKSEALITPVPGGVGLLTRCALLDNVVQAHYMREEGEW